MSYQLDIIQLHSENLNFYSDYVPVISFKNEFQKAAVEKYIFEKVKRFFEEIDIDIDVDKSQLYFQKTITEEDFKKIDIRYFYENLFYDLGDRKSNDKLEAKIKWGITFDEKCVPIQLKFVDRKYSGYNPPSKKDYQGLMLRRYGTIDINGSPIFYYIYFTIQEILDVIKRLPKPLN